MIKIRTYTYNINSGFPEHRETILVRDFEHLKARLVKIEYQVCEIEINFKETQTWYFVCNKQKYSITDAIISMCNVSLSDNITNNFLDQCGACDIRDLNDYQQAILDNQILVSKNDLNIKLPFNEFFDHIERHYKYLSDRN